MHPESPFVAAILGVAVVIASATAAKAGTVYRPVPDDHTKRTLSAQQAILWKYTARCALRADQELEAPAGPDGDRLKFKGALGLAPEWRDGKCDAACQERVSSCLAALTNQTGDHVALSLLSAAPSLSMMSASESDLSYPYQEGAFFGNVFAGESYVCRGHDADKAAQLKRFCATSPDKCSGLAHFVDAGSCEQSCQMSCSKLSDATSRCAAVSCRDPKGRVWNHPITTYLRNRIEAGNADAIIGAVARDSRLERMQDGGQAVYRRVHFGRVPGEVHAFVAKVSAPVRGGQIEVWLDTRRLSILAVPSTDGRAMDLFAPLEAQGLSGEHDLVLKFAGLHTDVRVDDIGFQ